MATHSRLLYRSSGCLLSLCRASASASHQAVGWAYSRSLPRFGFGFSFMGRVSAPPSASESGGRCFSTRDSSLASEEDSYKLKELEGVRWVGCDGDSIPSARSETLDAAFQSQETKYLKEDCFANVAAQVGKAVVSLTTVKEVTVGGGDIAEARTVTTKFGRGSGTIIENDGTILTCAHVVHKARLVRVMLSDGRLYMGTVTHIDYFSDTALLKIKSTSPLPTATFNQSPYLRVGDWVLAMGFPLPLSVTTTTGVISCINRRSMNLELTGNEKIFVQTNCSVNPRNSGGPLLNLKGEIVGLVSAGVKAKSGINLAIPSNVVANVILQLRKHGKVIRPLLGMTMFELNDMLALHLREKTPSLPDKGIRVVKVLAGSPAHDAGILDDDVIVEVDSQPVGTISEMMIIIGDRVKVPMKLVVWRENCSRISLKITPEEYIPDQEDKKPEGNEDWDDEEDGKWKAPMIDNPASAELNVDYDLFNIVFAEYDKKLDEEICG